MISTALSTGSLLFSLIALYLALKARRSAFDCLQWVSEGNKRSVSLRQIGELSSELTDLRDLYSNLMASHKKLRSRIGMRELRERRDDEPAAPADLGDEKDKARLRLAAKSQGLLR